jgi:hypothetical protein
MAHEHRIHATSAAALLLRSCLFGAVGDALLASVIAGDATADPKAAAALATASRIDLLCALRLQREADDAQRERRPAFPWLLAPAAQDGPGRANEPPDDSQAEPKTEPRHAPAQGPQRPDATNASDASDASDATEPEHERHENHEPGGASGVPPELLAHCARRGGAAGGFVPAGDAGGGDGHFSTSPVGGGDLRGTS